jgi:hypothetical protein
VAHPQVRDELRAPGDPVDRRAAEGLPAEHLRVVDDDVLAIEHEFMFSWDAS